jgi:hypothetical protein
VIRFSAALVAVAIGVLIGGIATSRLLLVYIAIVVSAVALVALAIGVVFKREELFGEGQGLVPAGAGASPEPPVRAGESAGQSRDKVQASAHVAPPPPFQEAAGGYAAAFGGTAAAASSSGDADPAAARTAAAGQGRSADRVPPWETTAAREPWSSSTPDWMTSGQDERAASTAGGAGGRAPSAWQDTTPAGPPGDRGGGWGVPNADARAAAKAPRSWAAPSSPSVASDAPAVKPGAGPGAGSGSTTPSWFDRLGSQAAPTVATSTVSGAATAPGDAAPGDTAPGDTASGDTSAGDEDDDWPTRYSWLDDDTDESGEAGETVATDVAGAQPEGKSPVPANADEAAADADAGPEDVAPGTPASASPSARETADAARETANAATPAAGTAAAGTAGAAAGDLGDAAGAEEPDADIIAFPSPGASRVLSQASDPGTRDGLAGEAGDPGEKGADDAAVSETGSEPPPAAAEVDAAPQAALVAVVPGVPRYHRTDCVLIRFMPEGDVKKQSVEVAKDAGCTPCAACQPEG